MDMVQRINALRAEKDNLIREATALIEQGGKVAEVKALREQAEAKAGEIEELQKVLDLSAERAEPDKPKDDKGVKPFRTFGEQIQAIYRAGRTGKVDERLARVNDAVGMQTGSGVDGGFAIQTDFAGQMLESSAKISPLLSKITRYTVSNNANSAKWLQVDESDISQHVVGGVQAYWASEAGTVTATRPKFKMMKVDLEKLMGLCYVTEEMLEDVPFMEAFIARNFNLAISRIREDSILNGTGRNEPLGILNSDALVTVAKKSGQTADTIVAENILAMWGRSDYANRSNMVWLAHPDCEEQLCQMKLGDNLLWMPEGGLTGQPYQTLRGREIIYTDCCKALGDAGDICLIDPTKYVELVKGGARQDWSMHVEFLTDQMAFRIVMRCNGAPLVNNTLTIKNSTNTRSPFITLAARA